MSILHNEEPLLKFLIYLSWALHSSKNLTLWLFRSSIKKSTVAQLNECRLSSPLVILCCTIHGARTFSGYGCISFTRRYQLLNYSFVKASTRKHPKYLVTKIQEGSRLLLFSLQVLLDVVGAYLELPSADQVYGSM